MLNNCFKNGKVLIPYFTFGDPSIEFTEKLMAESFKNGADCIELGIPFSDPIADGPVIQASHQRALKNNPEINLNDALRTVAKIKKDFSKPIIFMSATNLILNFGLEPFFQSAQKHNLDGLVVPDLSIEEADEFIKYAKKFNIPLVFFVSPLTNSERIKKIVSNASGFIYLISTTGTTGERKSISDELKNIAKQIKNVKNIPVVVGFGVSTKKHLETIYTFADGAIIGSHFVKKITNNLNSLPQALKEITTEIKEFKQ